MSNTITVPNGFTVVATETYGCTLSTGDSIVVQTGGAIDFDQGAFFGDPTFGLAGVFVPDGVSAGSVDIDGIVDIGDTNQWSLLNTDDPTEWDLCVGSACPEGLTPTPVPMMGPWMLALLSALTGLLGLFGLSGRPSWTTR